MKFWWLGDVLPECNKPFIGEMDDILILNSALTGAQILDVSINGAGAYALVPEPSSFVFVGMGPVGLIGTRQKERKGNGTY